MIFFVILILIFSIAFFIARNLYKKGYFYIDFVKFKKAIKTLALILIAVVFIAILFQAFSCAPTRYAVKTAYYVPNGHSYHSTKSCPSLARSKNIKEASLEYLESIGITDPCDNCI